MKWYIWHAYWYTIQLFGSVHTGWKKVLALGRKKYTIFTLWCLFTAQNRTSHYYFPFTIGWFIISLHRFVPSLHCLMRGLGGSQYLPLTNLATFSSFMHKTKLLPFVIQITSRPPYSTSSTSLCNIILHICRFNPLTKDCTRPKDFFYHNSVQVQ